GPCERPSCSLPCSSTPEIDATDQAGTTRGPAMRLTPPITLCFMLLIVSFMMLRMAPAADAKAPTGVPRSASAVGLEGMSVNGSIHPHGLPTTYYFEYGPTAAYGSRTEAVSLPPRLAAYYRESWEENTGGWAGWGAKGLEHHPQGGAA